MRNLNYLIGSLILIVLVFTLIAFPTKKGKTVIFLSGAGMKAPVKEIVANFKRETGIEVQTQFDGSSILRNYIIDFRTGDIFLPGDKKNLDVLVENGLVEESSFIALHIVSILVSSDAKEKIKGLDDLAKEGIRIAISNPELASLGRIVTENIIKKHPKGSEILKNVVVYGSSSQDVLRLYREEKLDAVIEWDVMASTPEGEGLTAIPIEKPYQVVDELYAGLLTTADDPELAKQFYLYLATTGKEIFRKHGYKVDSL